MSKLVKYTYHKTPFLYPQNIKDLNEQIWKQLHSWVGLFDCIFDFSHSKMTKRVIFLLFENEECVGYASFRQNNKGISSYHGTYFPSINCYLESWRLKNEMLFLEFFQQIYQNLQEPFLIETEYESDMKTYIKNEHCLPIVPFYHEGCGFCVFPKTHFRDMEFDHNNWTINEDEDNIDWNAIDKRCSAMKIISSSIYPGLDKSNKIIEWS